MASPQQVRACRCQFVLGPRSVRSDTWQSLDLARNMVLSFDRDLAIHQAASNNRTLTLLGYILDWAEPEVSSEHILQRLADASSNFSCCADMTGELGGRWALIFQDSNSLVILPDATGQRQICFVASPASETIWCASQPKLLAEVAGLDEDREALAFIDRQAGKNPEYWWPGDRLPYLHARALLPNHFLDLRDKTVNRYLPTTNVEIRAYDKLLSRITKRLRGTILAASNRFELALGLSAGWDSRVLLAASRSIRDRLVVYTAWPAGVENTHADFVVPKKLTKILSLKHEIVKHPTHVSEQFDLKLQQHTWRPHSRFAPGLMAEFDRFSHSKVAVIGNISEVARLPYRNQADSDFVPSGESLAALIGMANEDLAIRALGDWLKNVPFDNGIEILDLFYWEQRLGRWLAANCLEFDFAWQDICLPFNCRALISDLLACDEQKRKKQYPELYVDVMKSLWPDVLSVAINPRREQRWWSRLRRLIRQGLR